jgi:hypothetical protein
MKIDFMRSWSQNQDLNWGEMLEVSRAAEQAGLDKAREIRKRHRELESFVERSTKDHPSSSLGQQEPA